MLSEIGGDFNMYDNDRLSDISSLTKLIKVEGNFFVIDNGNLLTEEVRKLADQFVPDKITILDNKN